MSFKSKALIKTLKKGKSWEERRDAAKALASFKEKKVVDALIGALENDDEWVVRCNAATSLGDIGDERAIPALSSGLLDEKQRVQENCATALAKFGSKGRDILSSALQNKDRNHNVIRSFVIKAMGATKNPVFLPLVIEAINDPVSWVSVHAIRALGAFGDTSVADTLLNLLRNSNNLKIIGAAKESLIKLGIDASADFNLADQRMKEILLSNLKALKVGMSESEVEKLVGGGSFGWGSRIDYKTQFGSFQLIIANGRLVEIPEGFGPANIIKKLEEELSK